jgi:hypothetical protein
MRYTVINPVTGFRIESHMHPMHAFRACVVLNAHEVKNGRGWMYQVDPPCDPIEIEKLNLPSWVYDSLFPSKPIG